MVPLQRPDEMHAPSPSWMQTTSGYEDVYNELGIPTMITWSYDGKDVAVEGSWDDWKTRFARFRIHSVFNLLVVLICFYKKVILFSFISCFQVLMKEVAKRRFCCFPHFFCIFVKTRK